MANPVSIVQAIIDLALKIKEEVETFQHNQKDCRRIGDLVAMVRDVAEGLRKSMKEDGSGALVGGALKALKQALERAWNFVTACEKKNIFRRACEAHAIAEKLRRVRYDVSLNLSAVVLANGVYNTSELGDIKRMVADLHADVADNTRMLAKIMEIVVALTHAHQDLAQQVARLLQNYSDSTDDDASYYQNASTKKIEKTDAVAKYSTMGGGATAQEVTTNVQPAVFPSATATIVSGSHITTASSRRDYDFIYQRPNRACLQTQDMGGMYVVDKPRSQGKYSKFLKDRIQKTEERPLDHPRPNTPTMSSSVIAVRDLDDWKQVSSGVGKLLVLAFMKSGQLECEIMKPILESIAADCKKNNVKADFYTIDVDSKVSKDSCYIQALAKHYFRVEVMPTILMMMGFQKVGCFQGRPDKEELTKCINKYAPKK